MGSFSVCPILHIGPGDLRTPNILCSVIGPIPDAVGLLTNLRELVLYTNKLSGWSDLLRIARAALLDF